MAQTSKAQQSRLTPSPKALQKALEQSAKQAQTLADAFGVTVPSIKPKTASNPRNPGAANGKTLDELRRQSVNVAGS